LSPKGQAAAVRRIEEEAASDLKGDEEDDEYYLDLVLYKKPRNGEGIPVAKLPAST